MTHSPFLKSGMLLALLGFLVAPPAPGAVLPEHPPQAAAKKAQAAPRKKVKVAAQGKAVAKKETPKSTTARPEDADLRLRLATSLPNSPRQPGWLKPPAAAVYNPTYAPAWQQRAPNPYLAQQQPIPAPPTTPDRMQVAAWTPPASAAAPVKGNAAAPPWNSFLPNIPILPGSGQSMLPTIKKVYPTGDKPLVVVSFKCPTEMVGVSPPSVNILHNMVAFGMDGINKTNLLGFNLQQVCQ